MNCTKEEALLILGKWVDERSPLLLNLQVALDPEIVCFRGRIFELANDGFRFMGKECSISIPIKSSTFEYDEVLCGPPLSGATQSGATPRLRLYVPLANSAQRKNEAATVVSSILSITEFVH
jgi:hypothetical protein